MTKEEVIEKAGSGFGFLENHPEWCDNERIVLAALEHNPMAMEYISSRLKQDKNFVKLVIDDDPWNFTYIDSFLKEDKSIVMQAIEIDGEILRTLSPSLRKDKDIVLTAIRSDSCACLYSLLEEYKDFNEVIKNEGESFLFSCWNNFNEDVKLQVANHPNFLPTQEQIETILEDQYQSQEVKKVYQLRKNEWLAKIEKILLIKSIG